MKLSLLALSFTFLLASSFAQDDPSPKTTPSTAQPTTSSSTSSTTVAPTKTTTSAPKTTTEAPKTTTEAPKTTTTEAPKTTTEPPKTTTTTPQTTTISTTSVSPSPVTPTAEPIPEVGNWNVTDGINTTCIRASLQIRFKIETEELNSYVLLTPDASTDGSTCNNADKTQELVLTDSSLKLQLAFEKKSDNVYIKNITATFYFPKSGQVTFTNDTHLFATKAGNSYFCKTRDSVNLENATMEIFSIKYRAFGPEFNTDFGTVEECGADSPINDIVPIAVGVALLALVVVVLIAYLVGRRRSRQKGYQSV